MKALILRNDSDAAVTSSQALLDKGFQILCVEKRDVAETLIRMETIDLLVMDEELDGCLTHTIALSAERKNPYISSIIVTERAREETDDLYDLIPSLYALIGQNTSSHIVGQLALSSVANIEDLRTRVRKTLAADVAEELAQDDRMIAVAEGFAVDAREDNGVDTPQDAGIIDVQSAPIMAPPQMMPDTVPIVAMPYLTELAYGPPRPPIAQAPTLAEDDVPSYEDMIFSAPVLADLANERYFDDIEDTGEANVVTVLPDLAGVAAQNPLVLTRALPDGVQV